MYTKAVVVFALLVSSLWAKEAANKLPFVGNDCFFKCEKPFLEHDVAGPENVFFISPDERCWEKLQDEQEEGLFIARYSHVEEPISSYTLLIPVTSDEIMGISDVIDVTVNIFNQVFNKEYQSINIINPFNIHGKEGASAQITYEITSDYDSIYFYVDALLYKGENYILIHSLCTAHDETHLKMKKEITAFLEALVIHKDEV